MRETRIVEEIGSNKGHVVGDRESERPENGAAKARRVCPPLHSRWALQQHPAKTRLPTDPRTGGWRETGILCHVGLQFAVTPVGIGWH
jgi:hypothetical protein